MRIIKSVIFMFFFTGIVSASLPRMAVVSIDFDDFAPNSAIISEVIDELSESGRFQMVEIGDDSFLDTSPDLFMNTLRMIAADYGIDVFLALEMLPPEERDRTTFHNDTLVTIRTVSVDVLGRFYSSTGTLIGTLRNTVTREEVLPFTPDTYRLAIQSAQELASRAILELFPMEVTFTASGDEVFTVPLGSNNGIEKGTIMAVVASSSGIPDDITAYQQLRSRGLLQIMETGNSQSTARLLSGQLIDGGAVTAVEQSAPAVIFLEYSGSMISSEPGTGIESDNTEWSSYARLGIEMAKWGFSFGGGVTTGGLQHSSSIGVDLQAGSRIPISSPSIGLRLSAGGQIAFYMQDVRSTFLSSSATAVSVSAVADATMEYLFSGHLGLQLGVTGILGTSADSWTVQEITGHVRDAEPSEIYYTELKQGPVGIHAGLMYFIF